MVLRDSDVERSPPALGRCIVVATVVSSLVAGGFCVFLAAQLKDVRRALDDLRNQVGRPDEIEIQPTSRTAIQGASAQAIVDTQRAARARAMTGSDAAARVQTIKGRSAVMPATVVANFEGLMAKEPRLPKEEQEQSEWLRNSMQAMPATGPTIVDPQMACQGRRCEVSGLFSDENEAQEWARRYVLVGGGRLLQRSKMVISGVPDGTGQVQLHLYLY